MSIVNVRDARERIAQLLDEVAAGEEVVILRRGKPAARMLAVDAGPVHFPDRSDLRVALPPMRETASETVRRLRDEERY